MSNEKVLVFRSAENINKEQAAVLKENLAQHFPDAQIVVLGNCLALEWVDKKPDGC